MISRRAFITVTGAGLVTLHLPTQAGVRAWAAPVPEAILTSDDVPKFVDPLPIPGVMPKRPGPPAVDRYRVAVRQFRQQMLPTGLPTTTVWGYGPADRPPGQTGEFGTPSLTIEATVGTPVEITWINDLVDTQGRFLPHLLPVDPSLHWANPPQWADAQGVRGPDRKPALTGLTYAPEVTDPARQYGPYRGPVPLVAHLHGAVAVGDESDGYTDAWYLPAATNIPAGYATVGTWHPFFAAKAGRLFGADWGPGRITARYPNSQRAGTLWFHDHALGLTRLNVYAGPVGFYLLRGGPAGDEAVLDRRTGEPAILPGGGPGSRRGQGRKKGDANVGGEFPLAIQDRTFTADGSLFYPDGRAFFDGANGPWYPQSDLSPIWNPEFFGNTLVVNGKVWPRLEVEQRRYRFRVLNGCQSRFLILDFSGIPGVEVRQIGNDNGFTDRAISLTQDHRGRLVLAPAERADLIVDFARVPPGQHVLRNLGPDEPYGGGEPGTDFPPADPASTGQVLRFDVTPLRGLDRTTPPEGLLLPTIPTLPPSSVTRRVALMEHESSVTDGPHAAMLGAVDHAGHARALMWDDPITENPQAGSTETWEIYNLTVDAHPVHIHEAPFQVVDRQAIQVDEEHHHASLVPGSTPEPPHPNEAGLKDTVIALPRQVTRIRVRFTTAGQYVWHCHVLEHEDNEMMRPFRIGPVQDEQPG